MLACPLGLKRYQGASMLQSRLLSRITTHGVVSRRWTVLLRDGSLVTEQRHVVKPCQDLVQFPGCERSTKSLRGVCLCPEQEANSDLQLPITEREVMQRVN